MAAPLLAASDLTVVRGGRRIVDGATFAVDAGAVVVIQGASGSGKSTLLRAMAALIRIDAGRVAFEGGEPRAIGVIEYRRRVAYVPQLPRMFDGTVADNVRAGPRFRGVTTPDEDVARVLEQVGLAARVAAQSAADLSGGERLRVAFARALANDPRVLLLDEPTSALDPGAARVVLDLVEQLAKRGISVVVVTHAAEHAARLGGTHLTMNAGALAAAPAS